MAHWGVATCPRAPTISQDFRRFRVLAAHTVQMAAFWYHFGRFRPQGRPGAPNYHFWYRFGVDLDQFGPQAAQVLQITLLVTVGAILSRSNW